MPTLPEIRDDLIRLPSSGVIIDDTKYDFAYVEALIHQYRARAIFISWQNTKRINPLWTQQIIIEKDDDLQESELYTIFPCPPAISMDSMMDGFLYIGTEEGDCAFRKVTSRADLANRFSHRYSKSGRKVLYSDGMIEVHGEMPIDSIRVDGIMENPTLVPTYNKEVDQYPASEDILVIMKDMYVKEQLMLMTQTPKESSTDNPKRPNAQ